jgi:hypothetical protein
MEEEAGLPIFDIMIIRTGTDTLETTVYRKPSASNRYIHYTSEQAWKEKMSAIWTLKKRALEYCSNERLLFKEFELLLQIFKQNGYPEHIVRRILFKESKPKHEKPKLDFNRVFYVPYHPRARRLCKILEEKFAAQTVYSKTRTLGDMLKLREKDGNQIKCLQGMQCTKFHAQHVIYLTLYKLRKHSKPELISTRTNAKR